MAILFFILKLIGWLLLAILLLLLAALIMPLGIRLEYHAGSILVQARFGPLHFTLWPRKGQTKAKKPKQQSTQPAAPPVNKTVEGEAATVSVSVQPDKSAAKPTTPEPPKAAPTPEKKPPEPPKEKATPETAEEDAKDGGLPFGISDRIDAALKLLADDPMAFAKCVLGHTGWLGRQLLRTIQVRHLDIFWTITADDAAATAQCYGAALALSNNILAFVQQYVRLQSDRLWLEPDFTGQRKGERNVSFSLTSCAAALLWLVLRLLHRLWKDPQLQPAAKS